MFKLNWIAWFVLIQTPAIAQASVNQVLPTKATFLHNGKLLEIPSVGQSGSTTPWILLVRKGTVVTVLERSADGRFFKVEHDGQQGYISEGYLDMRDPEIVRKEMNANRDERADEFIWSAFVANAETDPEITRALLLRLERAPWRSKGTGNSVFDKPTNVTRVRITGETLGESQNFIVACGERSILNTIVGDKGYIGVHKMDSCGEVEIKDSDGVMWTFVGIR